MARNFKDWLQAYVDYASFTEAPPKAHFWTGVSAVAGALRRKVWLDMVSFKWFPNFYVLFVAPPGIVAKTTTADVGMDLLREVPGIDFGPSVVTWQSLVQSFAQCRKGFEWPVGTVNQMAALTISSGEFGNLLNPQDKEMVDMLVNLWDGRSFKKQTKFSGNDDVVNPWINLIACTTPDWISGNFPEYMIGGGFTSRCVFVYMDRKHKFVPYPDEVAPAGVDQLRQALIQDLEHISQMAGAYALSKEARAWGREWYHQHYTKPQPHLEDGRFGGYIARKQTHIHKLAIVLAASQRDDLVITIEDLVTAAQMVTDLEGEMTKVFSKIGLNDVAVASTRLLDFIKKKGTCQYAEAYRFIHAQFPQFKDFEEVLKGLIKAGYVQLTQTGQTYTLSYADPKGGYYAAESGGSV